MSAFDIGQICILILSGIGFPVLAFIMNRQDADRKGLREEIHSRLNHLDECIDSVRGIVQSHAVTKAELSSCRAEINDTLTRMRQAISADTNGLHDRLMRLEEPFFKRIT